MFFYMFTFLSWVAYILAGVLFAIYFSEESPGMIMIFLVPLLICGLLFGMIASIIRLYKPAAAGSRIKTFNMINNVLLIVGVLALNYCIQN